MQERMMIPDKLLGVRTFIFVVSVVAPALLAFG